MADMKRSRSEIFKRAEELYRVMKTQSFEEFSSTPVESHLIILFYYFTKFDKMLIELFLNLKIIIHLTILIYLNPRFQPLASENTEKIIVSGNLMITFFKKYKLLVDSISQHITTEIVCSLDIGCLLIR